MKDLVLPEFAASQVDLFYQQDNMEFLRNNNLNVLNWPPRSPDLSPIETFWNK